LNLAPVGISTYTRLSHLQRTIDALERNTIAAKSDLYIFSDGPRPGDEEKVEKVRGFLRTIAGFKSVSIFEREANSRVFNNRDGIKRLLKEYGKMIYLEEYIVTAPGFLAFMNLALDTYENNQEIFSICGYRPPIEIPAAYDNDAFVLPRFSAWGFGIWKDRFDLIEMEITPRDYKKFLFSPVQVIRFCRGGRDMLGMLRAEARGKIDALDVKIFYLQFLLQMKTVYPVRFLASNIGHDGTGLHCLETSRFDVTLDTVPNPSFSLPGKLAEDPAILKSNAAFRSRLLVGTVRIIILVIVDLLIPHRFWRQGRNSTRSNR